MGRLCAHCFACFTWPKRCFEPVGSRCLSVAGTLRRIQFFVWCAVRPNNSFKADGSAAA